MRRFGSSSGTAAGASAARDRATAVARSLREASDPSAQAAGLNQLCEMLNTGTEETLAALRPDQILPGVVQIMNSSHNPDLTLTATRALTYFVDAIQGSSAAVAACGGVDAMCSFLLEIRDIELAEQALVGLDKIAQENPAVLLQSRGPEAFLLFVDFFSMVIQRRAVSAVANLARRATSSTFHRFVPVLQQLRNMILHDDDRMAENALQALSRIVQGVQPDHNKIQAVLEDAVPAFVEALEGKHGALAAKILSEGAQSPKIASTLVDSGIVTVVAKLLGGQLVRSTPAPTPNAQTPQLGPTSAGGNASSPPLHLAGVTEDASSPLATVMTGAASFLPPSVQQQQQQQQQNPDQQAQQLRPEMALDLVTVVLRLLPEVHDKDFMAYLTEGCKFFERTDVAHHHPRHGSTAATGLTRMLELPPGLPAELQETFRRMLEAAGHGTTATTSLSATARRGSTESSEAEAEDDDDNDDDSYETVDDDDEEDEEQHARQSSHKEFDEEDRSASTTSTASGTTAATTTNNTASATTTTNNNLQELARAAGVTVAYPADARWQRCVADRHSCDICGKRRLPFSDWFRSNDRDDYDICRACFIRLLRLDANGRFVAAHGKAFSNMEYFDAVHQLARAAGVTIAPDMRWGRCVADRHQCDVCRKNRLAFDDWFRSNEKTDSDVCRTCFTNALRENRGTSFVTRFGRTFTDMKYFEQMQLATSSSSAANKKKTQQHISSSTPAKPLPPLVRPEDPRVSLLKDSPYILPRVAEGMNAIVKYRMGSEDPSLHARVLDLIHRVVAHLTGDEIRHYFADIPLTTILAKTLSIDPSSSSSSSSAASPSSSTSSTASSVAAALVGAAAASSSSSADHVAGEHIVSLAICQILLEKMNKTIVPYFFRNGLSRALTVRSNSGGAAAAAAAAAASSSTSSTAAATTKPLQDQLATSHGRRQFVASLAHTLNHEYFKDVQGSAAFNEFSKAATLLIQYKFKKDADENSKSAWDNAIKQLVSRFGGGGGGATAGGTSHDNDKNPSSPTSKSESGSSSDTDNNNRDDEDGGDDANATATVTKKKTAATPTATPTPTTTAGELPSVSAHELDDSGMLEGMTSWLQACATNGDASLVEEGVVQAVHLVSSLFQITDSQATAEFSSVARGGGGQHQQQQTVGPTPPGSPSGSFAVGEDGTSPTTTPSSTSGPRGTAAVFFGAGTHHHHQHHHHHHHISTALHRFISILQDIVADCDKFDPTNIRIQRRNRGDNLELRLTKEGPAGNSVASSNEMKVSIDKQASVGAIEDFLRGNVFHVPRSRDVRRSGDDDNANANTSNDEPVEEILPLATTISPAARPSIAPASAASQQVQPVYLRCGSNLLSTQLSMIDVISKYMGGQDAFDQSGKPLHFHFSIEPFPVGVITAQPKVVQQQQDEASPSAATSTSSSSSAGSNQRVIYDEQFKHRIFVDFKQACVGKLHVDAANIAGPVARAMRLLRIIHVVTANLNSLRCYLRMKNLHKSQEQPVAKFSSTYLDHLRFAAGPLDQDDSIPGIRVSAAEYVSRRLTAKCEKVLGQQSILGSLRESWCTALAIDCPFLLPLDTRVAILELGFLGTARGLVRHAERTGANDTSNRGAATPLAFLLNQSRGAARVPRKKFRVWRDGKKVLDCASEIFKRGPDGGTESVLEFEFYGEVGSGLGPTLEFYSLACEGLQKKIRGLFRSDNLMSTSATVTSTATTSGNEDAAAVSASASATSQKETEFCEASHGLFLALTGSESDASTLGSLLTRCLMDRRVASLYLSSALVRLLKGEQLVFDDVSCVLPVSNWHSLMDIHAAGTLNKGVIAGNAAKSQPDCPVSALCLNFELPFQPIDSKPIELKPNGSNVDVVETNCVEYVELVVKNLLACDKIRSLVAALRTPLVSVLDTRAFRLFEPQELASIWKGVDRATTLAEFQQYTIFDHGFTSSHPTARMLLEVLSEMGAVEQHAFFRFLTGSPSLPVGGLAALRPRFTVVRKSLNDLSDEQMQLPSAMTCQNYLKLPMYETKEKLKDKLVQAVHEGAGSFLFT